MAKIGNTIATLFIGAAAGVVAGYVLATDKETRREDLEKIKKGIDNLKGKLKQKESEMEEEIYHS
jgi:gas vesicle protein